MARLTCLKPRIKTLGATQHKGWASEARGSRQERGYGAAWDRARKLVMQRDCGLCQPCRRAGRIAAARAVDHIVPKSQGGTDGEHNLQAICDACHQVKTQRESRGG